MSSLHKIKLHRISVCSIHRKSYRLHNIFIRTIILSKLRDKTIYYVTLNETRYLIYANALVVLPVQFSHHIEQTLHHIVTSNRIVLQQLLLLVQVMYMHPGNNKDNNKIQNSVKTFKYPFENTFDKRLTFLMLLFYTFTNFAGRERNLYEFEYAMEQFLVDFE